MRLVPEISIHPRWSRYPPSGGVAVVIDVLRFSTTVCALLHSGRRSVYVAENHKTLQGAGDLPVSDVFSELDFSSEGRRFDNSPYQALTEGASRRNAYVTTTTGAKALWACGAADRVLVGCFANFDAVLGRLKRAKGPVWLVPAAVSPGSAQEDEICAQAFQKAIAGSRTAAQEGLAHIRNSSRIAEFLRFRPSWGDKDLGLCLGLNRLPLVPEALFPIDGGRSGTFAKLRRA